jgi:small subunit ribosomal protein S6
MKNEVRKYESVVIFHSKLNEASLQEGIKKVEGLLKSNGATDIVVDNWGRKEIAYEVKKEKYGIFVLFNYDSANHDIVEVLSASLVLRDDVMKFQSHRVREKNRKFKGSLRGAGSSDDDSDSLYQ